MVISVEENSLCRITLVCSTAEGLGQRPVYLKVNKVKAKLRQLYLQSAFQVKGENYFGKGVQRFYSKTLFNSHKDFYLACNCDGKKDFSGSNALK